MYIYRGYVRTIDGSYAIVGFEVPSRGPSKQPRKGRLKSGFSKQAPC